MSDEPELLTIKSNRFGDMSVPAETLIVFPNGLIGFPRHRKYVMFDHKPPFAWLHSAEDPNLAFVVIDGFELVKRYELRPPLGDRDIELQEEDEYATLVIVTVRPDPRMTTANIKAPLFVNLRNRRGIQMIFDDAKLPTRLSLWGEVQGEGAAAKPAEAKPEGDKS